MFRRFPCNPGGGGGGGTLIFSYIYRLGPFGGGGGGGGFRKKNIFGGMKIMWIFLRGHPIIGLVLWVISMYFRVFSYG